MFGVQAGAQSCETEMVSTDANTIVAFYFIFTLIRSPHLRNFVEGAWWHGNVS